MSLSRLLYNIFYEGAIAYAKGYLNEKGEAAYKIVKEIPLLEQIEQHLKGEIVLGAYSLVGSEVRWCCWDIDCKKSRPKARELAKKLSDWLNEKGIPHIIEFSGNKGYHIIVIFSQKESAAAVKKVGEKIRDMLGMPKKGDPHVEFFPKQSETTEKSPYGNLLRLPLGFHPKSRNAAVFVKTEFWEDGEHVDPEEALQRSIPFALLEETVGEQTPIDETVEVLVPFWESGQRHDISLYVSGFFAQNGWTEEAVSELITKIHEQVPEGELKDQLKTVKTTFTRFYAGESVIGFTGLDQMLPGSVLKRLVELAGKQVSTAALQVIDRIRLSKGPVFLKVRSSATTAIHHFKEHGRLVRDISDIYWLSYETRKLITVNGSSWERLLHNQFGLNSSESFGRQVSESIRHYAYEESKEVTVAKRSYWTDKELLINLGNQEIYTLTGDPGTRRTSLNGEEEVLFINAEDTLKVPNLSEIDETPISPWPFLTDDVNFRTGDSINATSIQQRELLKAFTLSIFFAQALPTRPILTILADSGAGKTTTARRILRLLEGPSQDVLGVIPDKPDSLRASIQMHKLLVLDNLEETKAHWLTDMLNRLATGAHIELRELHTTNRTKKIVPDCYIIITATKMPFSEETVYTRLLPIQLDQLLAWRPEKLLEVELLTNFNGMWMGMLDDLDKVVCQMNSTRKVDIPSATRLADFSIFCNRIRDADFIDGNELVAGLGNLVDRQKRVLEENSPLVEALQVWMRGRSEEITKWMGIAEIFSMLQKVASMNGIDWRWSTAQGLSKHIGMLEPQLIRYHGMSVRSNKEAGRDVKQYRFEKKMLSM